MNLINISSFLKCDAESCNYSFPLEEGKTMDDYLGYECPKCGANMLTEEDLHAYKDIREAQMAALEMLGITEASAEEVENLAKEQGQNVTTGSMHVHGGVVKTTINEDAE